MPQAWTTAVRLDVVSRLAAAIAATADDDPLHGVSLPANRWSRFRPESLPGLFVRVARIRRQGSGSNVPLFVVGASIEIHAAVAALEADAGELDARLEAIFDRVDLVLLEDPAFVARFTAIESADVDFEDGEGSDHYVRFGVVTYVVTVEQEFEPRVPDALTDVGGDVPHAPMPGGDPGEEHTITFHVGLPEE